MKKNAKNVKMSFGGSSLAGLTEDKKDDISMNSDKEIHDQNISVGESIDIINVQTPKEGLTMTITNPEPNTNQKLAKANTLPVMPVSKKMLVSFPKQDSDEQSSIYITDVHFQYFPSEKDIFYTPKKSKPFRLIFDGQERFNDSEIDQIQKCHDTLLHKCSFINYEFVTDHFIQASDENILRLCLELLPTDDPKKLDHEDFDVVIKDGVKWLADYEKKGEITLLMHDNYKKYQLSGGVYLFGRDSCLRPILIIDLKHITDQFNAEDEFDEMLIFIENCLLQHCWIAGQIEQYVVIIDCSCIGIFDISVNHFVNRLSEFNKNPLMRVRVFRIYCQNIGMTYKLMSNVAMSFIDDKAKVRIKMSTDSYHKKMWKHISKYQVQRKFKGFATDYLDEYWPAKVPNHNYFLLFEKECDKLVSVDSYYERYLNGYFDNSQLVISQDLIKKYEKTNNQNHNQHQFQPEISKKKDLIVEHPEVKKYMSPLKRAKTLSEENSPKKLSRNKQIEPYMPSQYSNNKDGDNISNNMKSNHKRHQSVNYIMAKHGDYDPNKYNVHDRRNSPLIERNCYGQLNVVEEELYVTETEEHDSIEIQIMRNIGQL